MTLGIALKAFAVWLGILLLAIANAAIREWLFIPALGDTPGLIVSGILLSIGILVVVHFTLPLIGRTHVAGYALIGFGWLCITLLFEFIFGRLQGKPWPQLFEAYMFKDGNIWPIVLIAIALAPYLSAKFRGWV